MTLVERDVVAGASVIRLGSAERDLFLEAIAAYPMQSAVLPSTDADANLHERVDRALRQKRSENSQAAALYRKSGVLVIDPEFNEHWDFKIDAAEVERLLQILNDVRVGLWIKLGRPDSGANPNLDLSNAAPAEVHARRLIYVCGLWQSFLVEVFAAGPA